MTSTAEGLEQAGNAEAVNSEAGFAAALAAKGVEPDKETSSDTSVLAGLETVEPAQARDPETGRFVPKQAPAADTSQGQGADTSTDGGQFTSDDPAVAAFLAKYDGNLEEAIKGAANAQSLIGRRDEEREALANQVAELRGLVEGLKTGMTTQQAPQPRLSDEDVEETAANLVSQLGYAGAAERAANDSLAGDARVYDSILESWVIEQPIAAQRFDLDFQMWKREQAAPKPQAVQPDAWVEERKTVEQMEQTFASVRKAVGAEAFAAITTADASGESPMSKALAEMPEELVALVTSDDAAKRLQGTTIVANRAVQIAGATPAPVGEPADPNMPASVARKLAGASVATAGLRPAEKPDGGGNGGQTKEEAIAAFKSAIVAAETTSVASGLTYGPQQ